MTFPVTPAEPLAMATRAQTADVLGAVADVLDSLGLDLAKIVMAGDLNEAQRGRIRLAVLKVDGLEALFRAECARQAAVLAVPTKES